MAEQWTEVKSKGGVGGQEYNFYMVRKRSWGTHARWFISSSWVFNVLSAGLAISWNNSLFIQWVNKSVWNQGCCLFILEGGGGIKSEGGEREDELGKRKSSLTNNIEQNWALKVKGSRLLLLGVVFFFVVFFFLGGGGCMEDGDEERPGVQIQIDAVFMEPRPPGEGAGKWSVSIVYPSDH